MKKVYLSVLLFFIAFAAQSQIINFTDANFKAHLLQSTNATVTAFDINGNPMAIDANDNNEIEVAEAANVYHLDLGPAQIANVVGLEYFINLRYLNVSGNYIQWLDVTMLTHLKELHCSSCLLSGLNAFNLPELEIIDCRYNVLTNVYLGGLPNLKVLDFTDNDFPTINLSGLQNLEELYLDRNELTQLDLFGFPNLKQVFCAENNLTAINFSGQKPNMKGLYFYMNPITAIDLSGMPNLETLNCYQNQIAEFDFSNNTKLKDIFCAWNTMTTLDLSMCTQLVKLTCNACPNLVYINMKNGTFNWDANFQDCPNLQYVCADDDLNEFIYESSWMQNLINIYQYANCHLNSYCSFTPGGDFYTFEGNSRVDSNNNGCDANDPEIPVKFTISDGTASWSYTSNTDGHHAIAIPTGTYTITPTHENPTYFNFSPTSVTVDFPTQASPQLQDFCLTPNGIHPDLEISILPIGVARPGFDAHYRLLAHNKGNVTLSGTVSLAFEDDRMDFISAIPAINSQTTGNLAWNFSGLESLETRIYDFTMNVNSPMETPPVNIGQQLNFTATINPVAGDDYPFDNTVGLKQTVVGSLDPNDKTCLEGNVISPEMAGQYVHYLIRFENTGTFAAENVVVKDMIDLAKFDLSSLVPLHASHPYVTKITGNKVEFIFEGINLPFDDANNDGYIAFKIKTQPTLVEGDSFSNSAAIYFDYNFPVVTDPATTLLQSLGNPDFNFSDVFTLYPNPAKNILNIQSRNGVEVKSVSVYNMLGQLLQIQTGSPAIDISELASGNYILSVSSDKGKTTSKFTKN